MRSSPVAIARRVLGSLLVWLALTAGLGALALSSPRVTAAGYEPVDTALVVAVDVSNSVDDARYKLQMEGIAAALTDESVLEVILNGPRGAILFSIVTWSDRPEIAMPWFRISSKEQALEAAAMVRALPRFGGEFTCMGRMMQFLNDKVLSQVPAQALRTVVDVSGDGRDNCNPDRPVDALRDELASYGTIINGLPILEGSEADSLEDWYRENVKGGPGSFILPANGFNDFGRAIRQKFLVEISGLPASEFVLQTASALSKAD